MPDTKLARKFKKKPPVNHLSGLFRDYIEALNLKYDDVGDMLGYTGANVSKCLKRPASKWTVKQINDYCRALDVPYEEAYAAVMKEGSRT